MAISRRPLYLGTLLLAIAAAAGGVLWAVSGLLGIESRVGSLLVNTAWLVVGTELLALPLGVLLAVAVTKTDVPGRRLAWLLTAVAIFVPLYVVAAAWDAGFGVQGWHTLSTNPRLAHQPWLSGWRGAIWVHAMAAVPWVALIVAAGLRAVDADLEEDALLRMPAYRVLWRVTLRQAHGAIAVAAVWVAIAASAEIAVTDLFQVRTFAEEAYTQAALGAFDSAAVTDTEGNAARQREAAAERGTNGDIGSAGASPSQETPEAPPGQLTSRGLWLGIGLSAVLVVGGLAAGRRYFDDLVQAPVRRPWVWRLRAGRWPAATAVWFLLLTVVGVPLGNLVYKVGVQVTASETGRVRDWSAAKAIHRVAVAPWEYREELWHSVCLGTAAATAALVIGTPLAWTMRSPRRVPWLRLGILAFLLALPGPLLGIGLIRVLNQSVDSPLRFLAVLYDSDFAPWMAQTLRALPLVTLVLWPALASVPQAMLDTAATDGAGWWRRLVWIALPQRWPALVAAWLVGLAIAVGELAATVLVVPPGPTTISVRIFSLIHYGVDDRVASICLVSVLGLAAVTAAAVSLLPRRIEPISHVGERESSRPKRPG